MTYSHDKYQTRYFPCCQYHIDLKIIKGQEVNCIIKVTGWCMAKAKTHAAGASNTTHSVWRLLELVIVTNRSLQIHITVPNLEESAESWHTLLRAPKYDKYYTLIWSSPCKLARLFFKFKCKCTVPQYLYIWQCCPAAGGTWWAAASLWEWCL